MWDCQCGLAVGKRKLRDIAKSHIWQGLSHMVMPQSFRSLGRPIKKVGCQKSCGQVYAHQGQYLGLVVIFLFFFFCALMESKNCMLHKFVSLSSNFSLFLCQFTVYVFCIPITVKFFILNLFFSFLPLPKQTSTTPSPVDRVVWMKEIAYLKNYRQLKTANKEKKSVFSKKGLYSKHTLPNGHL